eukprot:TRINITY_DN1709_c0_g1_i1.p1 TRINITY_DN1709_c0_g1~~TRINITY_DN1709_c0_g1_i1.p1  ORF type:complete len:488 (+),score=132.93 TRINITY_DN1709_c0_g1_i1:122-1465(+)
MFGWLKRVNGEIDGLTGGEWNPHNTSDPSSEREYVTDQLTYVVPADLDHSVEGVGEQAYGSDPVPDPLPPVAPMNGFAQSYIKRGQDPFFAMAAFHPDAVPIHTTLALEFAVFDRWFCAIPSATMPNRLAFASATSDGSAEWDIPRLVVGYEQKTIFESLEEDGISWVNYFQEVPSTFVFKRHRVNNIDHYRHYTQFLVDAAAGTLPQVSFIDPRYFDWPGAPQNDNHPGNADVRMGEQLLKEIYEVLRNGPLWEQTALIISYDEHGGFYDHVPTPHTGVPNPDGKVDEEYNFDFTREGVRVPTVVISPWVDKGTVVHGPAGPTPTSEYEHASFAATLKNLFGLSAPFLTERDAWAGSFHGLFNRTTARTDCPMTLPEPPAIPQDPRSWTVPLSGLQQELVQLASVLTPGSAFETGAGMTEEEGSAFVKEQVDAFFGRCVHGGADAH